MKINFKKKFDRTDAVFLAPFFEDGEKLPDYLADWAELRSASKQFTKKPGETIVYFSDEDKLPPKSVVLSLGKKSETNSAKLRNQFATIIKNLKNTKVGEISILINSDLFPFGQAIGEGISMANYNSAIYKTGKDSQENNEKLLTKLNFISSNLSKVTKYELQEGLTIGNAVNKVRDLINGPSNIISVDGFTKHAESLASANKFKIKVIDKKQLEKLKMGALLGVNLGSELGAKLLVLEYLPLGKRQDPVALVGKGVTFDTGGVNIKPSAGLGEMKKDMSGAAAVLGVFSLLNELDIKQNVIGLIPLTDNAVDAKAIKPSDIVTAMNGLTIEIGNTDAEGRLILCDAITYALKNYKLSSIIDIATLTGACLVALGDQYAGMFGNNQKMKERLQSAALETDELVWEMPIHQHHRDSMKGTITDLNNIDASGMAGASTAAAFLEYFVEKTDWIHLDIAGVSMPKKYKDYDHPGATGFGVRLLTRFLQNIK